MKIISPSGACSTRGPMSRYFFGRRDCQTSAGSTTWSSTEMIFGISGMGGLYS